MLCLHTRWIASRNLGGGQSERKPEEASYKEEDADGNEEAEADARRERLKEASGGLGGPASPLLPASPQQTEQAPSSQRCWQQQGQSQQEQQQRQAVQPCEAGPSRSHRVGPAAATSISGQAPVHNSGKKQLLAAAKVVMREPSNGDGGKRGVAGKQGQLPVPLDLAHQDVAAVFQSNLSWFCVEFAGRLKNIGSLEETCKHAKAQSETAQTAAAEAERKQCDATMARDEAKQRVAEAIGANEEARRAHTRAKVCSLAYYEQLPSRQSVLSEDAVRLGEQEEAAMQLMRTAEVAHDIAAVALTDAEDRLQQAKGAHDTAKAKAAERGTALAAAFKAYNEYLQRQGPEQVPGQPGTAPMEA